MKWKGAETQAQALLLGIWVFHGVSSSAKYPHWRLCYGSSITMRAHCLQTLFSRSSSSILKCTEATLSSPSLDFGILGIPTVAPVLIFLGGYWSSEMWCGFTQVRTDSVAQPGLGSCSPFLLEPHCLIVTSSLTSAFSLKSTFLQLLQPCCQWWRRDALQLALAGKSNSSCTDSQHGLWVPGSDCNTSSLDLMASFLMCISPSQGQE